MEKTKQIVLATIVIVAMLVLPLINAAAISVTWNPKGGITNYTNQSTSFAYNCTTSVHGVRNVTVYANNSASVMNALQVFTNTSVAQTAWTGIVSIQAADDGSNQNISCFAQNRTLASVYSKEILGRNVRLDSTNPVCNITKLHSTIAYAGLQTVTYYSSDVLARRLTTVDVNGPGKQTTITTTSQNGPIDLKSNDTKYTGSWTANMTVTDWSGNSCTASTTFKSYLPSEEFPEEPKAGVGTNWLLLIIAGIVLYLIFKKK